MKWGGPARIKYILIWLYEVMEALRGTLTAALWEAWEICLSAGNVSGILFLGKQAEM